MHTKNPPNSKPARPPIEQLRVLLSGAEKEASKPRMPQMVAEFRIESIRARIRELFGDDKAVLDAFPALPANSPQELVRENFALVIASLRRLITEFESVRNKLLIRTNTDGLENEQMETHGSKIFIGHGHSLVWREVKDFLADRLNLPWDEFNRESVAGIATSERWSQILDEAFFAFLVMTAEDEHVDSTIHARQNVIHEIGLFQGRLGPRRAIVLLEEGCAEFSNIFGLSQIHFAPGRISQAFEEMRRVLERENIVKA